MHQLSLPLTSVSYNCKRTKYSILLLWRPLKIKTTSVIRASFGRLFPFSFSIILHNSYKEHLWHCPKIIFKSGFFFKRQSQKMSKNIFNKNFWKLNWLNCSKYFPKLSGPLKACGCSLVARYLCCRDDSVFQQTLLSFISRGVRF